MQLGIFARTYRRATLDQVLDAVLASAIAGVHFNFSCASVDALPRQRDPELWERVAKAHRSRGLSMIAVSGTFNAIHPDVEVRRELTRGCVNVIEACGRMKVSLVSLCTGTRCVTDMWKAHPDNNSPQAWSDMCRTLEILVKAAEAWNVRLGIEPERATVVSSARCARRLLDEMRSKHLGIIMDGANLVDRNDLPSMPAILKDAFDLLGGDIACVHAKEISAEADVPQTPNTGRFAWRLYFELLRRAGYNGPVVLHNLPEHDVPRAKKFIEQLMAAR